MKYIALFRRLSLATSCLVILTCVILYRESVTREQWKQIQRATNIKTIQENATISTVTHEATSFSTTRGAAPSHASTKPTSSLKSTTLYVHAGAPKNHSAFRKLTVFYNRIGKCGSRSLFQVVTAIAKFNKFRVAFSTDYSHESPPPREAQVEMVKIARLKPPTFYNRHVHFLDFKKHGFEPPVYINMIRDPIDRFSSHYNYIKYGDEAGGVKKPQGNWDNISKCVMEDHPQCRDEKFMFYMGLYFCGLENVCKKTSKARIELAKKHIDEDYYVIGTLEDFENTLRLLEKMLPEFFRGARYVWNEHKPAWQSKTKTKRRDFLTDEAKRKLRADNLADEYEVYEHAKRKFERLKREYGIS